MSIHKKLQKNKVFKDTLRKESDNIEYISSGVIAMNLLHSGYVRGGIAKGTINMLSADSALGKSFFGLSFLKNAQKMGMECLVIDSEKSFDYNWARAIGVDISEDKLTVVPTSNIIEIKQLIQIIVEDYNREQRRNVFVLIDSWGTLVSNVMLEKASAGKDTQDMSLPRWKNELANLLKENDCTYYVINHVYDNTGGFGDPLKVPGGKRLYFNCNSVVLAQSKARDKDGDEISGAIVTAYVQKGRTAVEKSKLQYRINHDGGLDPWYGLLDDAIEGKYVENPTNGFYSRPCVSDDKKWREKQLYCSEFWVPIFKNTDFEEYLNNKYSFKGRKIDIAEENVIDLLED